MNDLLMIQKLKAVGVSFDEGLRHDEFDQIESVFGIRFPTEIRSFLSCALPVGDDFFPWRDLSAANVQHFSDFYCRMEQTFLFDIEHDLNLLHKLLRNRFSHIVNKNALVDAILAYVRESPRLVPFYGHRCFFDGMDHMPIVSFHQPVDSIYYGYNFENYLEVEFLNKDHGFAPELIEEKVKQTGIWYDLVDRSW